MKNMDLLKIVLNELQKRDANEQEKIAGELIDKYNSVCRDLNNVGTEKQDSDKEI